MNPRDVLAYLERETENMVAFLGGLAGRESPSGDKAALDRLGEHLAAALQDAGGAVEMLPQGEAGNHLRAVFPGADRSRRVLVLCHMDTVWAVGQLQKQPLRREGDRLYGPGVYDMKGGITQAVFALRALRALGRSPAADVVALVTSDEEVGSPTSRPIIEAEARRASAVLVLEPPVPPYGALKTWRKGVGMFRVRVTGRAAHAGADPEQGVSAIEELARQVVKLHSLTDYATGTTVNVGVVRGGTRSNVVAAEAEAEVDLRVMTPAAAEQVVPAILGLKPFLPGATVTVEGGMNRPPMERTPAIVALFERARELARELGFEVTEGGTGGGSDGNFTAALGIPTLDGLGAMGDGAHALHEHVLVPHLAPRAALLARLLESL